MEGRPDGRGREKGDGWTDEGWRETEGGTHGRTDGCGLMDGQMDGWMDGWMDG